MSHLITAGALRAIGIAVKPSVPDCATVPRHAMKWEIESQDCDVDTQTLTTNLVLSFTEPFSWVEVRATISKEPA